MGATTKRMIQDGMQYERMFPAATGVIKTIRENASVGDTLTFIQKIVPATLQQTKNIAASLKGRTVQDTCRNIWQFVYTHIAYRKDRDGYEQVRSPRRSWRDRKQGVDCDCYTTFISSILTNLHIPHKLRITKYYKPHFQHIYPVVMYSGREIIMDCVTDRFNYEVPYSEKKDVTMDLQYLDGLDAIPYSSAEDQVFAGSDEFGELGLFGRRRRKRQAAAEEDPLKNPDAVPGTGKKKKKGFFRKLLNVTNKINPLTLALRNGVLAAMKLNIGKIGSRLRWSYLSPNAARAKGIDMGRYAQLVKTRQKLEDIFSNAGGNPVNMKKAILKGKGNKDHAVNGLLGLGALVQDEGIMQMSIHTPLPQLLGPEIYYDENVRGMDGFAGFGELGEPITLATVGAAAGVIAAIAASLKKIGDIFKGKKTEGSEDFSEENTNAAASEVAAVKNAAPAAVANSPAARAAAASFSTDDSAPASTSTDNNSPAPVSPAAMARTAPQASDSNADNGSDDNSGGGDTGGKSPNATKPAKKNFWEDNKKWIVPAGIGVVVLGVGLKLMSHSPAPAPVAPARGRSLSGVPKKRKHPKRKPAKRTGHGDRRKSAVALL
ncbi:hypothetical protein HGH93_11985 [Chitinophaga polysaccharea]|uniref:hypothetical protein n=1 Tax=Chitinophaga polysaccharea TaxID=1293035 RepID=UPI001454EF57|nr:hypothetical protein [Chitinophaga polysaccharea]NLR58826.1 hypothetical protein [Chitinophaga polysaccharea]